MRTFFWRVQTSRRANQTSDQVEQNGTASPIRLIVGLGNPGSNYAQNRHNVGFMCINRLARRADASFNHQKLASVAEGLLGGRHIVLAKPRTFVNNSGQAVSALLKRYHLNPQQVLVIYDDLDLPIGVVRMRERGSHGGQNGMKSILAAIGSAEFPRIRIGIGRPSVDGKPTYDPDAIAHYVLANPPSSERAALDEAMAQAAEAAEVAVKDGLSAAMAAHNRRSG